MQAIYYIGRNTFRECLRQPIFVILLLTCLVTITFYPAFSWFVFRAQEKLVVDGSLAAILLFGWVTAVLCASHAISREIETGTVLLILSKPVSRAQFIIAKMLGILAALTVFGWLTAVATVIALRMATDQFRFDPYLFWGLLGAIGLCCLYGGWRNYMAHASFPAMCVVALLVVMTVAVVGVYFLPAWDSSRHTWEAGAGGYNWRLVRALVLIVFAVWAMGTLATALSTRLNLMSNLTVCAVVFVVGLLSRYVYLQLLALKLEHLERWLHSWFYLLFPCLAAAWLLAAHHYHQRRHARLRRWEVHGGFALLTLALAAKAVYNHTHDVVLEAPAPWMTAVAKLLLAGKDGMAATVYALVPNWQNFWLVDVVTKSGGKPIPATYLGFSLLYILLFIGMFTVLALLLFAEREVGRQDWQ